MRCVSVPLALIAAMGFPGCKPEVKETLALTDVRAYAPLTRNAPGVAYFTLHNPGDVPIVLRHFASDCFARVELHTSSMQSGIASMHPVNAINIDPENSLFLRPGGLHLMLMDPNATVEPGMVCTVEIGYSGDRRLTFQVELLDRREFQPAEPIK